MLHPITTLPDGTEVWVNLVNSEASYSIARQPQLLGLTKEALKDRVLTGAEVRLEHNMGRVVGYDYAIATAEDDNIFYAKILHEHIYTRFVKNAKPPQTKYLALVLRRSADGSAYLLYSVRIGRLVPPRPGALNENRESEPYWANHAFMHTNEVLQPRTISKERPY